MKTGANYEAGAVVMGDVHMIGAGYRAGTYEDIAMLSESFDTCRRNRGAEGDFRHW